jgi:EAL domain-containing protein (putative c-di-GMP-specific phosphodiesterase class I)
VWPGGSDDLADSYCGRVLSGDVPSLISDAASEPGVADIAATWELPIGAHLSVPITTPDGRVYGTMCCFSRLANPALSRRDVEVLRIFAEVVGAHLEPLAARHAAQVIAREAVSRVLDEGGPGLALQPIVSLRDGGVAGYEALARFPTEGGGTEEWFRAAAVGGLGTALESAAVHAAVKLLPQISASCYLAVNVSAGALLQSASIEALLTGPHASRLVVELTEHQRIEQPARLDAVLGRLRAQGARIAVDDAGSGYAGLERVLSLRPEVLKLDRTLVNGVAGHPGQQAMCAAMVGFTRRVGADLVAEGVESGDDLLALRDLGVGHAQGYLLGRPRIPQPSRIDGSSDIDPTPAETAARAVLCQHQSPPSADRPQ